jgi:hypothetical protein
MWGYPTRKDRGATPRLRRCLKMGWRLGLAGTAHVGIPHTQRSWSDPTSPSMLKKRDGGQVWLPPRMWGYPTRRDRGATPRTRSSRRPSTRTPRNGRPFCRTWRRWLRPTIVAAASPSSLWAGRLPSRPKNTTNAAPTVQSRTWALDPLTTATTWPEQRQRRAPLSSLPLATLGPQSSCGEAPCE